MATIERNFCYLCGAKLEKLPHEDDVMWRCNSCGLRLYPNPTPAVDVALFNDDGEVLLCIRGNEPCKGMLNLAGGFMQAGESLEQTARRELAEELGLATEDYGPLVYVSSFSDTYPILPETQSLVVTVFVARAIRTNVTAQDDVAGIVWRKVKSLHSEEMAGGQAELDQIIAAVRTL